MVGKSHPPQICPVRPKAPAYPRISIHCGNFGRTPSEVLTYVRNNFGNKASAITPEQVAKVREATKAVTGFYEMADLLKEHPLEK